MTGSYDHTARLWEVPRPLPDEPDIIATWVAARSGMQVNEDQPKRLTEEEWSASIEKLNSLGFDWQRATTADLEQRARLWHLDQAAEAEAGGQWFAVDFHLKRLIEMNPDDANLLARRADVLARRGQWKEAATTLTKAIELKQDDSLDTNWSWCNLAPLLVETGDLDGFAKHRAAMLARFGKSDDPTIARRTSQTCALCPLSEPESSEVGALVEKFNKTEADWRDLILGLVEYRQGHFSKALEWANKVVQESNQNAADATRIANGYLVLAMAQHELKNTDSARRALVQGEEMIDTMLPKLESGDIGKDSDWKNWLSTQILLREAKQLIDNQSSVKGKPANRP